MAKTPKTNSDLIEKAEIRTMRKDISWLQSGGKERLEQAKQEKERHKRELLEKQKREEEEKKRREELRKKSEEEEKKKAEEEKRRLEEENKKTEELLQRAEEERKRMEEELRKREQAGIIQEAERRKMEEKRRLVLEEIKRREEEEKKRLAEIQKITQEEIRKTNEEEDKKKRQGEEKRIIEEWLQQLAQQKKDIELRKGEILEKMSPVEKMINIIAKKEIALAEDLRRTENIEFGAGSENERREAERKRWKLEEKRMQIEKESLPWEEEKNKFSQQVKELNAELQSILFKETGFKERQREILAEEELMHLNQERIDLQKLLKEVQEDRRPLEMSRDNLYKDLLEIEDKIKVTLEKERKVEEDKVLIEEREELASGEEKVKMRKERWETEERRREVEKERWALQDKKSEIEAEIKKLETSFQKLEEKESSIADRIKRIDSKLGQGTETAEEKPAAPGFTPPFPEKKEASGRERLKETDIQAPKEEKSSIEAPKEADKEMKSEEDQKAEYAQKKLEEAKKRIREFKEEMERKRAAEKSSENNVKELPEKFENPEIETEPGIKKKSLPLTKMEKIWQEREEQQKKLQKEFLRRIGKIGEDKKERIAVPPAKTNQEPGQIIRPLAEKPSPQEKYGIRIAILSTILVVVIGSAVFGYWFFKIREPIPPPPPPIGCVINTDCPTGQICQGAQCITPEPLSQTVFSPSLFLIERTEILSISSSEELKGFILQSISQSAQPDQFKRLAIEKLPERKSFKLKDFFEALLIRVPEELYQKLSDDFTLFLYSQSEGNRPGLAAEVRRPAGLPELLESWENTMESDLRPFFDLAGRQGPPLVPYFRNASAVRGYVGPNFRYLTISSQDLGILYFINENYFILASSWKSMERTINKLSIPAAPLALISDLKAGDSGAEVQLLQSWLKEDVTVYPQGLITGLFGNLTYAAVIRFQEKYASEILAPQGLSRGNGIVDSYTRIKLNELYGQSGVIPPRLEITMVLRYGDRGDQVRLLQTWLAEDGQIYPEKLITGWFGPVTQRAVIRFQEKYASEILAPQGLNRGSGAVDPLTIKKLNELYGE